MYEAATNLPNGESIAGENRDDTFDTETNSHASEHDIAKKRSYHDELENLPGHRASPGKG